MNDTFANLAISYVAIDTIIPNPRNARTHSEAQLSLMIKSLREFGPVVPIGITRDGICRAGHLRLEGAKRLGWTTFPAVYLDHLSKTKLKAYALADNAIATKSGWDDSILAEELIELIDAGSDVELSGFDMTEVDEILTPPDEVEERVCLPSEDDVATSRLGDLWSIGPHKIYCGDARESVSYDAILGDELARMVFSDPPYNVRIQGNVSGLGRVVHREFAMASSEMSPAEFVAFLREPFKLASRYTTDGSIHFYTMDWRHMGEILDASKGVFSEFKQLCVWTKQAAMGTFYRSSHELVFCFKNGRAPHINNFGLKKHRTNTWCYPSFSGFRKGRKAALRSHPTPKPVPMIADALIDCSRRGDIVLDMFAGSGSTGVAAHRTGRRAAMIEIDPIYTDVIIRRMQDATGLPAIHADGRTFAEIEVARANPEGEA